MLITECGSLQPGRGPSDYWLRIRSWNAYTHKFLQRPHQIQLSVPFAFLSVHWDPTSGNAAFIPKNGSGVSGDVKSLEPTPVTYFFELWRDFDGRRLPVRHSRKWLDVTALHDGNQLHIALTNMGGQRIEANLTGIASESLKSISQKRLYYRDGAVHFEDSKELNALDSVEVDVEETTVVTIELGEALKPTGTTRRDFYYAAQTAVSSDKLPKDGFQISIPDLQRVAKAKLVLGVQRKGGLKKPIKLTVNGKSADLQQKWTSDINNLFAPIVINIPKSMLKAENSIQIAKYPGLTITSIHFKAETNQ